MVFTPPKLNWYPNNELEPKQEIETITEIEPAITEEVQSVAKDVPEYPATVTTADELETAEIADNLEKVIEGGED